MYSPSQKKGMNLAKYNSGGKLMSISAITETYSPYQSLYTQNTNRLSSETTLEEQQTGKSTKPGGLLENSFEQIFGFQPKVNGVISLKELREHGTRQLQEFNRDLRSMLRENGIDTSLPIELVSEFGTGDTIVKNDHPDKEKIDQLFKENPELSNDFKRISSMLELAEIGEQTSKFHEAYSQNPQQAVAQYAYLFNTKITSSILLEDGGAEIRFQRIPKPAASNMAGYTTSMPVGLAVETEI
jgi:hypothetical protein